MQPFSYHNGQREIQREANSVLAADKLSTWVGPVSTYAIEADLIVLACDTNDALHIAALSGPAPLATANETDGDITVSMPEELTRVLSIDRPWGGIVINPATARRSRVAGIPTQHGARVQLPCTVAFTNCRKYMTPTSSTGTTAHVGPTTQQLLAHDDPFVVELATRCETAFLVTTTPDGVADVSHRGGPPGFLRLDVANRLVTWTEYLGDGMFVSTGNIRQSPRFALVLLDYVTGDALRLDGEARYTNVRRDRRERVDALLQAAEPFPVQGKMEATIQRASRLVQFTHPRVRVERRTRITSTDTTDVQHPQ